MKTTMLLALTALTLLLPACGSGLKTRRIPAGLLDAPAPSDDGAEDDDGAEAAEVELEGLVLNQNAPHEVVAVFRETPSKTSKIVEQRTVAFFASATELLEIGYRGALFASRKLEVEVHPDSTLKRAKITSTSSASDDLQTLTSAYDSIQESLAEPDPPPAVDPLDAENDALAKALLNEMLKANLAAAEAGLPLPYPDVGL